MVKKVITVLLLTIASIGHLWGFDETIEVTNQGEQSCLVEQIGTEVCVEVEEESCPSSGITACGILGLGIGPGCWVGEEFTIHEVDMISSGGSVPKWRGPNETESGKPPVENYKVVCRDSWLCWCDTDENGGKYCFRSDDSTRYVLRHLSKNTSAPSCSSSTE